MVARSRWQGGHPGRCHASRPSQFSLGVGGGGPAGGTNAIAGCRVAAFGAGSLDGAERDAGSDGCQCRGGLQRRCQRLAAGGPMANAPAAPERLDRRPLSALGGWTARCPTHSGRNSSLSLVGATGGRLPLRRYAGCEFATGLEALGLTRANGVSGDARPALERILQTGQASRAGPPAWTGRMQRPARSLPSGPGVRVWIYGRASAPAFAVVRRDGNGRKRVSRWTPAPGGLWVSGGPTGEALPLYRLDALEAGSGPVTVAEGEECVDACVTAWPDRAATTWAGGCGAWRRADWTPLRGRPVTLLADADGAGRACMRAVAGLLHSLGCAVWLVEPPGDAGDDVADWLAAGGLAATAARIAALERPFAPAPGRVGRGASAIVVLPETPATVDAARRVLARCLRWSDWAAVWRGQAKGGGARQVVVGLCRATRSDALVALVFRLWQGAAAVDEATLARLVSAVRMAAGQRND